MRHLPIALITLAIIGSVARAEATTLAKDGKSPYSIVVAQSPLKANARAAEEMKSHLKQMSGADVPVIDDAGELPEHAILIGPSRHLDALGVKLDAAALGNDGFVLKTVGKHLVIAGPGPRGSLYGTCEVLERLGVRWFTPKVTHVPQKPNVELPALDETQVPDFEYREPYYSEAWNGEWASRNKMIGHSLQVTEEMGGNIRYADFVHSFDRLVPPELHKEHPEYFPLIGGQRVSEYAQRCLTNPDVLKLTIDGVRAAFAAAPDAVITTVSQNDTAKWCECDECKKITAQFGGQHSGLYLWFVNKVAEAIEKDLPDKLIDTLAYQFTEPAPTGISPRKNVRVRLCPISSCQTHPFETDDFPASQAFVKNLSDWHKIAGDTLYIWHYVTNFPNQLMPVPDFNEFPVNTRLYKRNGVIGVFFQGAYSHGGGGYDAELKSWVMGRLLWDVDVDTDKLVTEWMQGVYGPEAAKPMRQWFDLVHAEFAKPQNHLTCYQTAPLHIYNKAMLDQGDALYQQALAAATTQSQKDYIERSRLSVRYLRLLLEPKTDQVLDQFAADVRSMGIAQLSESQALDAWEKEYREKHK